MPTFSSKRTAGHTGSGGAFVVDGLDLVAASFIKEAVTAVPKAGAVVVAFAGIMAERMKARVHIDEGDLMDSITADKTPHHEGLGVYADAGPDPAANPGAFKAHFWEHGTIKMAGDPFAGPAGDETIPGFVKAIKGLPSL